MSDTDIGARLRYLRTRHGLSQRALAKRAGVTHSTVSLIESNGVNPSVGALKRILDGIPIGLSEFFALEPDRPRQAFYRADELVEIGKGRHLLPPDRREPLRPRPADPEGALRARHRHRPRAALA